MKLELALALASEVRDLLRPFSSRLEIAGGVRRSKAEPHDLEIVCKPTEEPTFGALNSVDLGMKQLLADGKIQLGDPFVQRRKVDGAEKEIWCKAPFSEKYYRVKFRGAKLDVFVVTPPAEWGVEFLLRTGDGGHNIWMVTKGWPRGIYFREGRLVQRVDAEGRYIPKGFEPIEGTKTYAKLIPTPEEEDVFKALLLPWEDPKERVVWAPASSYEWEEDLA